MTQRGDMVTVSLQGDFGKPRPALIVQSDLLDALPTLMLCPISSGRLEADRLREVDRALLLVLGLV